VAVAKKKVAKKKAVSKKKTIGKKKIASKKKVVAKKKLAAQKKKAVAKKKVAAKKKAVSKKKVTTRKKSATTKEKVVSKKKSTPKKKTIAEKKKSVSKKKVAAKKRASDKRISKKKTVSTQTVSPKKKSSTKRSDITSGFNDFEPYQEKKSEEYMSPEQLEHFRSILLAWLKELQEEVDRTVDHMQNDASNFSDPSDRATQEEEFALELRTRDRERKLIKKIRSSLAKIDTGDYGYCDVCGVEIGIRRLEARPTADLCIDCKTLDEIKEKQMG